MTTETVRRVHASALSPDEKAIAAHGIGRGDFAAIVFSGSIEAIGEAAGYCTWSTAAKFALPDPRVAPEQDLARSAASPLPLWSNDRVRPTPGVCFVFADGEHPAIDTFRARDGVEFEHFVVLSSLTSARLMEWRVRRFLADAGSRPIGLLGFGDQGARFAESLTDWGAERSRIHVVDDGASRQVAAANAGFTVVGIDDPAIHDAALIASPLAHVGRFASAIDRAAAEGRAVLDNSLPWDGRHEFTPRGAVHVTTSVDRCVSCEGSVLRAVDNGLRLPLSVIADDDGSLGGIPVRVLGPVRRAALEHAAGPLDLASLGDGGAPGRTCVRTNRWFVGLSGQTNHHDAAFGIFAARAFLRGMYPETVGALLPSEHRTALGATPFESLLPRTCTGRSLGSPYMGPMEQTAIGVLARQACGHGAAGRAIIEIGSALGGSTLLMAAATRGASGADGPPIHSIDPDVPTRGAMRVLFEVEGYAARLWQIVKTSDDAAGTLGLSPGSAGMLFIDGLHTADAAAHDFANYAGLIGPGGIVAFHDCDARHSGVFRTVAKVAASDPRFQLKCLIDTFAVFERRA